jgi:hypothetical protein
MKNSYIIPAAMICAAILVGFWMLKPSSEPQMVTIYREPPVKQGIDLTKYSIQEAAEEGNIEAVKQWIAHIAQNPAIDVSWVGKWGVTALANAAEEGHKEIVELLIAAGADVNKTKEYRFQASGDYTGERTPLDLAIRRNRTEIADILRKRGGKTMKELRATGFTGPFKSDLGPEG